MRLKATMPLACLGVLLFCATGCNKSEEVEVDYSMPIRLSAQGEINTVNTRAASDFPNDKIYIRGVFSNSEEVGTCYEKTNWSKQKDNCYIIDASAKAIKVENGTYTFNWDVPQYWPLPGTHMIDNKDYYFLNFFSYSPATKTGTFDLTELGTNNDSIKFNMTLPALTTVNSKNYKQDMPDILYTYQGAKATRSQNKVHLGEFCHALSQVSLQVNLSDVSPNIYLKELSITLTKNGWFTHDGWLSENAEVDATTKDPKYTYGTNTIKYSYPLTSDTELKLDTVAGGKLYLNSGMSKDGYAFLVLPYDAKALVTLIYEDRTMGIGNYVEKTNTYEINKFEQVEGASKKPASLDRGKNTTLQINISGTNISKLFGDLEPWEVEKIYSTTID